MFHRLMTKLGKEKLQFAKKSIQSICATLNIFLQKEKKCSYWQPNLWGSDGVTD